MPALEHEHLPPGAREIGGGGQPVVPAPDDDRVISILHTPSRRRASSYRYRRMFVTCSVALQYNPLDAHWNRRARADAALCESLNFREWSGFYAVSAYEAHHEHEYNAIRNAAALIDVSPLFKYLITGPDAVKLVDRVITRDAARSRLARSITRPGATSVARSSTMGPSRALESRRSAGRPRIQAFAGSARTPSGLTSPSTTSRSRSRPSRCRARPRLACWTPPPMPTSTASNISA